MFSRNALDTISFGHTPRCNPSNLSRENPICICSAVRGAHGLMTKSVRKYDPRGTLEQNVYFTLGIGHLNDALGKRLFQLLAGPSLTTPVYRLFHMASF
jgi:hypothetical protein